MTYESAATPWEQRHAQIAELSSLPAVADAHHEALQAARCIKQTDDNAANTFASHETSLRLVDTRHDAAEIHGRSLDVSLAVLWSVPKSGPRHDRNQTRQRAITPLRQLYAAALSESSHDLAPINCLESSREGTVELVRCAFDRQIYILKSTTKGAAKRGYRTNAPMTERRLLSLARDACKGSTCFTPACLASFQSPGSLHILMEYCPAGDLYHFLESAGQAQVSNEARSKSGGLLVEEYIRKYAIDMVAAISWLHTQGYVHRDLKPGNWLFHRSGHLLLCDLASAAPFSLFDEIPASASLPTENGIRTIKVRQRRILYRHCCLIGTADYIAPEVFWAADWMSRRRMQLSSLPGNSTSGALDLSLGQSSETIAGEDDEDDEPPPEGPGLYGPECDWWSLGVILFEMVYKRMPFFSDSIAETMEMIKHHERYLSLDSWVRCSANLKDLILRLITRQDDRLGFLSSQEVQLHPFFHRVDWAAPWKESAPFVPHLHSAGILASSGSAGEPEPSILHSPRPGLDSRSFLARSFGGSQMWNEEVEDFPAFPNSVEQSRNARWEQEPGSREEQVESDEEDDTIAPSMSADRISSHGSRELEAKWAGFDPTWIGFTRVPGRDEFRQPLTEVGQYHCTVLLDGDTSQEDSANRIASTPHSLRAHETPDARRSAARTGDLHRRVLETTSKVRQPHDGRFVTPMRKGSYSNLVGSTPANFQTPHPGVNVAAANVVPASPYPFPVGTTARPRPTPAAMSGKVAGLRRKDLERARSASVSTGEGSDSRCSGGSNAKREISEREAWRELKAAVMQSARKTQNESFRRSSLVSDIEPHGVGELRRSVGTSLSYTAPTAHKVVSFRLSPRVLTAGSSRHHLLSGESPSRKALDPVLDTTPPHDAHSASSSPSPPGSSGDLRGADVDNILGPREHVSRRKQLAKRKSARQLLLKAQHRETPTRTARPASPLLAKAFNNLSVDAHDTDKQGEMQASDSDESPAEQRSAVLRDYFTQQRESTPQGVWRAPPEKTSAPQPAAHHVVAHLKRQGGLRRRDSHEMLSQYRMGINPDDVVNLDQQPVATDKVEVGTKRHLQRHTSLAKIDVLRANSSMTLRHESNLSSPSLPSLPDAFSNGTTNMSSSAESSTSDVSLARTSKSADTAFKKRTSVVPFRARDNIPFVRVSTSPPKAVRSRAMVASLQSPSPPSPPRSLRVPPAQPPASRKKAVHVAEKKPPKDEGLAAAADSPKAASRAKAWSRPALLKRASSYLSRAGGEAKRENAAAAAAPKATSSTRPSPVKRDAPASPALRHHAQAGAKAPTHNLSSASATQQETSPTLSKLHARYDHLQAEIKQIENRLTNMRGHLSAETG